MHSTGRFSPTIIMVLLSMLVTATFLTSGCGERKRIASPDPSETTHWEVGPSSVYSVPSPAGSIVADSVTGGQFRFPGGGTGPLEVARVLSGPPAPFPGHGFSIDYAGEEEVQLLVDRTGSARVMVLGYGRVDGALNEPGERDRWVAIPQVESLEGKTAFLLAMPYTISDGALSGGAHSGGARSEALRTNGTTPTTRPRGFSKYWISSLPGGSSPVDSMMRIELQASSYKSDFLAALNPARRTLAEAEINGRLLVNYSYDGFFYTGFWWRSLGAHGRLIHPTLHYRTNANAGNIAHELGHYFTHVLVGDDTWSALEGQAPLWDTGHGPRDQVGRDVLLEDYAYIAEYHLIGDVKGYDLFEPYVIFRGLSPLTVDFPGVEGFTAVMLASLVRPAGEVRDLINGRMVPVPVVGLSWGDIYDIVAQRATGVDALRAEIETRLGSDAVKLPVLLQRSGWSYSVHGRYLDSEGTAVPGILTTSVSRVGGVTYEGGFTSLASAANGGFAVPDEVFGGASELRAIRGPDTAFVAIQVDWAKLTTTSVDLGNLSVSFPPVITGLSATSGRPGDPVTINGRNFGASQGSAAVSFHGTAAAVTSWSDGTIAVNVPQGARSGPITVTRGGRTSNGMDFSVTGTGHWAALPVQVMDLTAHPSDRCNFGEFQPAESSFAMRCGFDNPNFQEVSPLDWETRVQGTWTLPPAVLVPGEVLSVTITLSTEHIRNDDPPDRSAISEGYIFIDAWGEMPATVNGNGTQTTTHVVRSVGYDPTLDRLVLDVTAGGYAGAGEIRRRYFYQWEP